MSDLTFEVLDCPTNEQLVEARDLRIEVFVQEQGFELGNEMDEHDNHCWHVLVRKNGNLIGNSRVIQKKCGNFYLGRVLIKKTERGNGYSTHMLNKVIDECKKRGYNKLYTESQMPVVGIYHKLGFKDQGPIFEVEGADHQKMCLDLS